MAEHRVKKILVEDEVRVEYSNKEREIFGLLFDRLDGSLKTTDDYSLACKKILELLQDKKYKSYRRYIHPAHVIHEDCIRAGCDRFNIFGHSDWGLDLGRDARTSNIASEREDDAVLEALRAVNLSALEPSTSRKKGDMMSDLVGVTSYITSHSPLRRRVRYHRVNNIEKLRPIYNRVVKKVTGSSPHMDKNSDTGKVAPVRTDTKFKSASKIGKSLK